MLGRYLNMMFYMIYRLDFKFHLAFKKINPVIVIHKLFSNKEKHKKYLKTLNDAMEEPEFGVSSMTAGGILYGLYFLVTFGLVNFASGYLRKSFHLELYHFGLMALPSSVIIYFLVFKGDKFLSYFDEFKKMPKPKMYFLSFLYLINALGILAFVISSFVYMTYRDY